MKREDLKTLGVADDLIDQIMALHGKDLEKHKTATETAKADADAAKAQLAEANTAIEGFKKLDVDGIKAAADDWKAKAEKAEQDAAAQVNQLKFDHALDAALTGVKAKDPVSVRAHLKLGDLKLSSEGAIIGLEDQLKAIRTSHEFLFEADKPAPTIVAGANNSTIIGDPLWTNMLKGAGLTEPKS